MTTNIETECPCIDLAPIYKGDETNIAQCWVIKDIRVERTDNGDNIYTE